MEHGQALPAHLHRAGVAVVPTGSSSRARMRGRSLRQFLAGGAGFALGRSCSATFDQFVMKPSIGAARATLPATGDRRGPRRSAHLSRLVARKAQRACCSRTWRASRRPARRRSSTSAGGQPCVPQGTVAAAGLRRLVEGLFAPEEITRSRGGGRRAALAAAAYAAIPFERPLYARHRHDPRRPGRAGDPRTRDDGAVDVLCARAGQCRPASPRC